jgi:L-iditol 2-dehydrogenase
MRLEMPIQTEETMKALVLPAYNQLRIEEVPRPVPEPHEVLIRVAACGICGSDVHGMDGSTGRRRPPVIMGHEASGTISEVGSAVRDWKPGDRVTFDSTVYCGQCWFCRRGDINLCDNRMVLGVSCSEYRRHGAFADYIAVPQQILCRLPDSLGFEEAALIEAVSVAVHAVELTPISLNDTAVVVGTGLIGLLVVQALRTAGCGRVIAVDLDEDRLKLAQRLGAYAGINAGNSDVPAQVKSLTGGRGADVAMEVVGVTTTVQTAVESLRKGGALTLVGNLRPTVELPLQAVVTRQLTLRGSCASCGEYPACLDLVSSGRIDVKSLISATPPLEEGPDWFRRLHDQEPGLMKVILKPNG